METRHNVSADLNTISNIFADESLVKDYQPRWKCLSERPFNDQEKAAINSCEVVPSQHGMSVCFTMINGHKRFIPLDAQSSANLGDKPSKDQIHIKLIEATQDFEGANGTITKGTQKVRVDIEVKKDNNPEATFNNPFGL